MLSFVFLLVLTLLSIMRAKALPFDDNEEKHLPFDCGIFPEKDFEGDPLTLQASQKTEFEPQTQAVLAQSSFSILLKENCTVVLCTGYSSDETCGEIPNSQDVILISELISTAACYCSTKVQRIQSHSKTKEKQSCAVIYKDWHYSGKKSQVRHAGSTGRILNEFKSVSVKPGCSISFWTSLHDNVQFSFVLENSTSFVRNKQNDTQLWYCCFCDSCSETVCKNAQDEIKYDEEDDIDYDFAHFADHTKKIIGVGRNYRWSKTELSKIVKQPDAPIIFLKPTSSFIEEGTLIHLPKNLGEIYYELELGVVIGKLGKNIPEEDALEHVAGYFLALDMTAKEFLKKAIAEGRPWEIGKGFDYGCPVSSFIPKRHVSNPNNLQLVCTVNGNVTQHENTNNMIFNVRQLIAYISKFMTLEPYDAILTGTPDGFGVLTSGDIVEGKADNLMKIRFQAA